MQLAHDSLLWRTEPLVGGMRLTLRDAPHRGVILVRERLRPLAPARALAERVVSSLATTDVVWSPSERLVTSEGEHAVLFRVSGLVPSGLRFRRTMGVVYGDDDQLLVDGVTDAEEHFDVFERAASALVYFSSLGLGHRRRRRWRYRPPEGWQGVATGLDSHWFAPRFPRETGVVTVHAAEPVDEAPGDPVSDVSARFALAGHELTSREPPSRLSSRHGLSGRRHRLRFGGLHVELVVLEDERFLYVAESLASAATATTTAATLDALVDSAEGIPLPEAPPQPDALLHWSL